MSEQEINEKLDGLSRKIDKVHISAEKTRKYFLWALIISLLVVVLPLIGVFFAIPSFISTYSDILNY